MMNQIISLNLKKQSLNNHQTSCMLHLNYLSNPNNFYEIMKSCYDSEQTLVIRSKTALIHKIFPIKTYRIYNISEVFK